MEVNSISLKTLPEVLQYHLWDEEGGQATWSWGCAEPHGSLEVSALARREPLWTWKQTPKSRTTMHVKFALDSFPFCWDRELSNETSLQSNLSVLRVIQVGSPAIAHLQKTTFTFTVICHTSLVGITCWKPSSIPLRRSLNISSLSVHTCKCPVMLLFKWARFVNVQGPQESIPGLLKPLLIRALYAFLLWI
jgi:hypothetical protein